MLTIRLSDISPCFPRGIPRGLIEAVRRPARPVSSWRVFRGVFPAASLKRVDAEVFARPDDRVFRGVFPAASLKHHRTRLYVHRSRAVFRGVFPRGLIEAD